LSAVATAVFGQAQTQNRDGEPVTPAARSMNWTSAGALNALFNDKARVKRFLNEVANEGATSGQAFIGDVVTNVYEYRVVDLDADGWLELVALVGGGRPSTALEIVFQTPGGVPLTDRLTATYEGFVVRELVGFDVPDLEAVLRDLDGDGTAEIVMPQSIGGEGASGGPRLPAEIPEVFAWKDGNYANVSARYPEFYRDEVLPRVEQQLQMLEALPAPTDPSEQADRRADRERVVREIAEARKRATERQREPAAPPDLTGVLDSELTAGTPWANVSCNKATTVERRVLPEDLAREGSVWSCMMLSIAPIGPRRALLIERRGREPVLWLDDNNDGKFNAQESHEFPQTGDLQVRIPLIGARFPEYPITVRYRWEFFEPPAEPYTRVLLESAIAYVGGTVTIGGRPVRVEYPVLSDMMPTITGGWFRVDANGDGRIDDDFLSEENTPPSTKVPIVRVGTRYVSTLSIDADSGIVKLKEHPSADYQRIVLRVGDQLPDFTYQDLTTRTPRALSDIHARLVLLVVWSTWCPPALDELPWIEETSRTLGEKGLAVLGLPDDEKRGDVEPVISRFHLTWPNADPESIRTVLKDRWQIAAVPQFIVLDGGRRIVGISQTFDSSLRGARLSKTLQQWLRESR